MEVPALMTLSVIDVPLYDASPLGRRREVREPAIRAVDFCRFPRVCADGRLRRGMTLDLSSGGLRVRTADPLPSGALLRLWVYGLDSARGRERLGRVAWTRPAEDGEHCLGIALLPDTGNAPIRLRYRRPSGTGTPAERSAQGNAQEMGRDDESVSPERQR